MLFLSHIHLKSSQPGSTQLSPLAAYLLQLRATLGSQPLLNTKQVLFCMCVCMMGKAPAGHQLQP